MKVSGEREEWVGKDEKGWGKKTPGREWRYETWEERNKKERSGRKGENIKEQTGKIKVRSCCVA